MVTKQESSLSHPGAGAPASLRVILMCVALAAPPLAGETARCPVRADAWVAMHRWEGAAADKSEALSNHGSSAELVIRGRESFALLDFDLAPAKGFTVRRAVLRIHRRADPVPLHTAGLSTISGNGAWQERAVNFFAPAGPGSRWSYPGSDLVDVTFAQGGSLYSYERAREAAEGWWEIPVPATVVHALLAGDQFGLMLTDEKGQTQTRHVFSSRESGRPPVLVVEGAREDRTAPGAARAEVRPAEPGARPGLVTFEFGGAGDDAGRGTAARYELRHSRRPIHAGNFESGALVPRWMLDPLAPRTDPLGTSNAPRDRVTARIEGLAPGGIYYFAARARDEAGNAGPVSALPACRASARSYPSLPVLPPAAVRPTASAGRGVRVWAAPELLKIDPRTGGLLEQTGFPDHRSANSVWDGTTVRLKAARNEFAGFQLVVESDQPVADIEVRLAKALFPDAALPAVFKASGGIQFYREWFVPEEAAKPGGAWYPDALVPLAGSFPLPSRDNGVPGQTVQPVFADVYVPKNARPGAHSAEVLVRAGATERRVRVEVDVLPLTLPDRLNFAVDLNCYSGVDSGYQVQRGTPEYRRLEHAYHRLAHLHRANLNVLGYSHSGSTVPDHAPPLAGEGAATRVASWSDWDAHFGPLLDGSAFAGLPRGGVPITAMYLPFFENWPGDLRNSYRFNDYPAAKTEEEYRAIIASHALRAAPIEECFPREYQERFSAVVSEFAAHLRRRGWTRTQCQIYFNNKYYYKRPSQGGRGVSWWLLDEPNHRDDVRALSFFASLARKGLARHGGGVPIILRTDISRVEWIRDLLPGQIDLNCVSRRFFEKNRYLTGDRRRFGRTFWNYAATNHPRESNVNMRAWCWRVWLYGGDGVVPWNTVRGAQSWERAEQLTVFYPGSRFGRMEPFASLRLKAFRRGQQDIEYLVLLSNKPGWDREAVSRAAARALNLSGGVRQTSEEDAGSVAFDNVSDAGLDAVRLRAARALMEP